MYDTRLHLLLCYSGAAEKMANVKVYISYFNLSAEVDSQNSQHQSAINDSYSLSQSMSQESQGTERYQESDEVKAEKKKLSYFQASFFYSYFCDFYHFWLVNFFFIVQ